MRPAVSRRRFLMAAGLVAFLTGGVTGGCSDDPAVAARTDLPAVYAVVETEPVRGGGDAADDPAIWIHPADASLSLVLGTDKRRGLSVYDLSGREVQFLPRGRMNNVDLRQGVAMAGGPATLAVATNRTERAMDIFTVSTDGQVELALAQALEIGDPYGICMHLDAAGVAYAYVNGSDGEYEIWRLNEGGELRPERIDRFSLPTKPEGCVVDDSTGIAYIGEEEHGIWKMPAGAGGSGEKTLLDSVDSDRLAADVEGLDIYRTADGGAILVASSQGDYTFAFYDLNDGDRYLGSVRVADDPASGIDGAEETDGLAVTAVNLGPGFEQGVLVVQDGFNRQPEEKQNFKLVPFGSVAAALKLDATPASE
ncbi:MAG: phytase [Gammaproteobacteria bacterium]|nr:phytase [Gammaproteobacteria bacterium]MYF68420.1 phytase [Gammaproteobacteria bacterium]MYK38181.1 phytase [Gammaproteobacteria bacterium]